jgi:RimJ/RimL family protein N-acetyltransferase
MAVTPDARRRSDRELIEIHVRTLFRLDARGRIATVNDCAGSAAPRFFVAWTAAGTIWRARHDLPPELTRRLGDIISAAPTTGDLDGPPSWIADVRAALTGDAPPAHQEGGPTYCFPDVIEERSGAVAVTPANADVLERWLRDWQPDVSAELPLLTVLVDGAAVAVCACARIPGQATEAGVETHPQFRGRGFAAIATAAWAREMRERGVIPLYSTSWDNHSSRRVAAKLGLHQYGASLSIL